MTHALERRRAGRAFRRWAGGLACSGSFALAWVAGDVPGAGLLELRAASASTFIELTLPELVSQSTSVVVALPLESNSVWEESRAGAGRRIVTYTRVSVSRVLAGDEIKDTWVRTLGGRVGDLAQHVDGDAVLVPNEATVLFLKALPDGPHEVVGMGQGQYPLESSVPATTAKLLVPLRRGNLLARPTPAASEPRVAGARSLLAGKTVNQLAELIATVRPAHVP